ncbi:MAG TPA: tetratricopeptide repeat protein [Pyrinomonadaceae bacterium]|nr:tetratricopeptide repeat protein [Pyrinomonadaceae bacterium]
MIASFKLVGRVCLAWGWFCVVVGLVAGQARVEAQGPQEELRARYAAAQKFEGAGDWSGAEREWREALRVAPEDARAWVNLGVAMQRQGRVQEAVEAWQRASAIDPKLPGAHFNAGLALSRAGEFARAVGPLRRALELEPENEAARRALALSLVGVERFQEASREIARLLARAPRDASLLELAAQSFMRQRRYAEASVVLRRRLDLPGATGQMWAQYGDALDGAGRTSAAVEAYERAVALAPEVNATRYGLGYLYWKSLRYDEAERVLLELLKRDPADARAAYTLGDLYLAKGDAPRSLPLLELAARVYPKEFDARFALGRALLSTGETARAIAELRAAVALDDRMAVGHFQLGRALLQAGQREEAKRELDRARQLHDAQRDAEVVP